jgi:hypothetical protein
MVVWTCRDTDVEKLHFDTRQFNHVIWTQSRDLRQKLTDRIRAMILGARLAWIRAAPHRIPHTFPMREESNAVSDWLLGLDSNQQPSG